MNIHFQKHYLQNLLKNVAGKFLNYCSFKNIKICLLLSSFSHKMFSEINDFMLIYVPKIN